MNSRHRNLYALLSYFFLSLVLTFPLVLHFATHVAGDGSDDPALAWNLWWVRYALLDLGRTPITTDALFFPIGLNLAFYTLTYLNAFLSIPVQFSFGLVPAANLNLLFSFTLSGWGTYLLVDYLLKRGKESAGADSTVARGRTLAAFAAGCLYAFSSNKLLYASLGQFNIASSQWIPFYVLLLIKCTSRADAGYTLRSALRYGFLLGLFLLFQALSEFIFASFLLIFTVAWLALLILLNYRSVIASLSRGGLRRAIPAGVSLLVAAITFTLPMVPILAEMIKDTLAEGDFIQSGLGFSDVFSNDLLGFFVPSRLHPLLGGLEARFHFSYINFGYLGFAALVLAFLAIIKMPRARMWAILGALVFLTTLGPALRINGRAFDLPLPFDLLLQIPFVKGNRYPSRWSVMLALCLAVLVGYAVAWLLQRSNPKRITLYSFLIIGILLFEHLSVPLPLNDFRIPEIYTQIAREPGDFTVLEIPVAWRNGFRVTGSYRNGSQGPIDRIFMMAQWYQTAQHHPLLNGNTSRNPELKFQYFAETPVLDSLIAIQEGHTLTPEIQSRDARLAPRLLAFFKTRYVIWHAPFEEANRAVAERTRGYIEQIFPLTKIAEEDNLVVYRVRDGLPALPPVIRADEPLARLAFGEGWGAFDAENHLLYAQRKQARLFMPLAVVPAEPHLAFRSTLPTEGQVFRVTVNGQSAGAVKMSKTELNYALDVPGVLRAGMNEIVLEFDTTTPVRAAQPQCENRDRGLVTWGGALVVRSAGEEQGSFGHIYVGGVDESPNQRGYNLVVLDKGTFGLKACAHFDTFASEAESARMAQFISQIADGDIVAVATSDEASMHLTGEAVQALRSLGSQIDLRGKFRWSHALIGTKGAQPGTVNEAASETQVSQLIWGMGLTEPNVAAEFDEIRIEGK